jgi:hypothetical protein
MFRDSLFTPLQLGAIQLPNHIIMVPLTRMRARFNNVSTPLNAKYYAQRAAAGLIISEGTAIRPDAHGYPVAPGIYSEDQIAGCRCELTLVSLIFWQQFVSKPGGLDVRLFRQVTTGIEITIYTQLMMVILPDHLHWIDAR